MQRTVRTRLSEEAGRAHLILPVEQLDGLVEYVGLLAQWAKRIRIVGTADPFELIERHIVDGLWLASGLESEATQTLHGVDVGAGAGLPGVPVAILRPHLQLTLVEPRNRRCAFLRRAASALGLNVQICEERIEAAHLPLADVAWSRATWPPEVWLKRGLSLISPDGQVVVFLGRQTPPPPPPGTCLHRTVSYTLADGTERTLAFYGEEAPDLAKMAA